MRNPSQNLNHFFRIYAVLLAQKKIGCFFVFASMQQPGCFRAKTEANGAGRPIFTDLGHQLLIMIHIFRIGVGTCLRSEGGKGATRSLDVSTPPFPGTSARNVVEQVQSSRWRGTAPCAIPRTDPFPPIRSDTHLPLSSTTSLISKAPAGARRRPCLRACPVDILGWEPRGCMRGQSPLY